MWQLLVEKQNVMSTVGPASQSYQLKFCGDLGLLAGIIAVCIVPWSRTRLGDRSFDVARPQLWSKLPASLRSSDSLCQFRRQLKMFLVKD